MKTKRIAIIHYSAPPVVGGVEAVIEAHANLFAENGYAVSIITGRGNQKSFPQSVEVINIPEIDSQHLSIADLNTQLEKGECPPDFDQFSNQLHHQLAPILKKYDHLIIHNILTKHFNLPLTAVIHKLIDQQAIQNVIAWCHDFTWTSPNSRDKVFPGYPWNLLRTYREEIQYVVVSKKRQKVLADLFRVPKEIIKVVYNGIDPFTLLGITQEGQKLIVHLELLKSDLNIIMPVRVTQAKNIEYALQVVEKIKSQDINLKLVITGPPDPHDPKNIEYYESLKTLTGDLCLENNVFFVYESGPDPNQPNIINNNVVGDLYRVSDLMFMPSHREGFGMPVLEAGMLGLPVVSTPIPASKEIAENDALIYTPEQPPEITANQILERVKSNPLSRLRINIRKNFTWDSIFYNQIIPILKNQYLNILYGPLEVKKHLRQTHPLWLFLDYDGTLANFAPTPDDIVPDEDLINLLYGLQKKSEIRIAIISGRRLAHIQKLLPVRGVLLAGAYGIEIQDFDGKLIHRLDYENIRHKINLIKPKFEELLEKTEGFYLEDKRWSLAIHARYANESSVSHVINKAYELSENLIDKTEFQVLGGDRFFEVAPILANKGVTVQFLINKFPLTSALPVYIGDDDKDEQAFSTVKNLGGIPIIVSKYVRDTEALLRFPSPEAVRKWITSLIK